MTEPRYRIMTKSIHLKYSHKEAASNLSDFFFRFHFHGLKSLPRAENLLFLSRGGVLAPEPKLFVRKAAPFCFFAVTNKQTGNMNHLVSNNFVWNILSSIGFTPSRNYHCNLPNDKTVDKINDTVIDLGYASREAGTNLAAYCTDEGWNYPRHSRLPPPDLIDRQF